ncbi:MAG: hypothetical protein Q9192_006327 [Flavoplaca navasiana]
MELIDLEAATVKKATRETQESGDQQDDSYSEPPTTCNRRSSPDKGRDARVYHVARTIVEEVLRSLPALLHRQLSDADDHLVELNTTSAEENTIPGASERTSLSDSDHHHNSRGLREGRRIEPQAKAKDSTSEQELQGASIDKPLHEDKAPISYKMKVKLMAREDIEKEKEQRRSLRSRWQGEVGWQHLEDPWKNLQRANGPLFDPSFDEQRKNLELELVDAIFSVTGDSFLDNYFSRGLPAISCWIGLVGLRLIDINVESRLAFRFIQSVSLVKANLNAVRVAVYLLNIMFKHRDPRIDYDEDMINKAWSMTVSETEKDMRVDTPQIETDPGKGPFYKVSDFGLQHLQEIGKVDIEWTSSWDEHLELKMKGPRTILRLYWFSPTLARFFQITGLSGGLVDDSYLDRGEEVARTLDLVLNPAGLSRSPAEGYRKLKAPEWLGLFAGLSYGTGSGSIQAQESIPRISRFWPGELGSLKICCEIEEHMLSPNRASPDVERITYSEFPHYYQRLRDLRNYMDSRKPRGILALWRDRRDSNTYYTFWLVVIFGCSGVLLGVATLAIAIIQAWGQLQSLHQGL